MAKGLAVPVRPGKDGGAMIVSGEAQDAKILSLALSVGDDANPFQELGVDERIVFKNTDASVKALIRNAIQKIVGKFPARFKISSRAPIQVVTAAGGDTAVGFVYKAVESGDEKTFQKTL